MNSLLITSLCVTQRLTRLIRLAGLLLVLAASTSAQAADSVTDNVANNLADNVANSLASCANFEQRRWMADLDTS